MALPRTKTQQRPSIPPKNDTGIEPVARELTCSATGKDGVSVSTTCSSDELRACKKIVKIAASL
jgi:hypothetical protein